MKNPFKKEIASYRGGEPVTPYQLAQQEWDRRMGEARVQASNWRLLALGALLLSLLLVLALMVTVVTRRDHLYVAEVSKEGKVFQVAPVEVRYQPTEAQKKFFIIQFLELTRSISLDPVYTKRNLVQAYKYLTDNSTAKLNRYFQKNNPIALIGKKTVSVQVIDINPVTTNSMHVDWVETVVNNNGEEEAKNRYSGIFTLVIRQPKTEQEMNSNPLGIYLVDFNISAKGR